jgi:trans-aconitate methyltransferase
LRFAGRKNWVRELTSDNWNLHWDRYADSAEKNPAQLYRRHLIFKTLNERPVQKVLDIGSGQGDFAAEVRRRLSDAKILGLELSKTGVEIAQRKVPDGVFLQQDLTKPAQDAGDYRGWAQDAVCSEVLEHVDDPKQFLQNVSYFLAPGARLIVTVPGGPMSAFDKHIGHRTHFTASSLKNLVEGTGFRLGKVRAAGFPFMNLYKLLVIMRGERLISDVAKDSSKGSLADLVMACFRPLFRLNLPNSPLGWQLVATLHKD